MRISDWSSDVCSSDLRTMDNPDRGRVPMAGVDPRQDGRFAAAWALGYVAASEGGRLETLTLGALTGPFGMLGPEDRTSTRLNTSHKCATRRPCSGRKKKQTVLGTTQSGSNQTIRATDNT